VDATFAISAHTNRVPVQNGHVVCASVGFRQPVSPDEARAVLCEWRGRPESLGLPSSPARAVVVRSEPDRPQPRHDAQAGGGMTVSVGRIRTDPVLHIRLVALGHNTIRGAAGGSLLNAELLASSGVFAGS
jgi:aspartate-semialdehyde dehydrogenase